MGIVDVNYVTKEFRLGAVRCLSDTIRDFASRVTGRIVHDRATLKALDGVTFSVESGEVLGIVGHNGAGKSTLLKLLAGISSPTRGTATVRGSVAPLIEIGAGIVPDLTGRENIYVNASILGMRRAEVHRRLDEIVAFAELEDFIDTPVKRYSSGMQVRLGFAVATSVHADILIADEVLAVGDIAFQRKCFDRMEEMIKRQGRTVLFVSHNIRQIERLCTRALLLDHGKIVQQGSAKAICEAFYSQANTKIANQAHQAHAAGRNVRMTGEVELESLFLLAEDGTPASALVSGRPVTIRAIFQSNRVVPVPEIVFGFHTTDFVYIASMGTAHINNWAELKVGHNVVECCIDRLPLVPGVFGIRIGVLDRNRREMFYGESLKIFSVQAGDIPVSRMAALGLVDIPARWACYPETATA
jgi:ABC-type polysaccharide/polyol phosphate transport system ATPase subunit